MEKIFRTLHGFPRTIFFFSVFAVLLAAFSGCQSTPADQAHFDEMPLDRRIGVIRSLGGIQTSSQGTHLLQLDDGDTILLRSLALNLDDQQYANLMVEIRGVLNYTKDGKPLMDVMNIDVLDQPEFIVDDTPQWKMFVSDALGFSVRYRDDLSLVEKSDGVTFERSFVTEESGAPVTGSSSESTQETSVAASLGPSRLAVHRFSVTVTPVSEKIALAAYLDKKFPSQVSLFQPTRAFANGLDVIKLPPTATSSATTFYFKEEEGPLYTVVVDPGDDGQTVADQDIFYEMLSELTVGEVAPGDLTGTSQQENSDTQENTDEDADGSAADAGGSTAGNHTGSGAQSGSGSSSSETVTVPAADNFNLFESSTLKFSVGYPKQWYFSSSTSSEAGVSRHYDFGGKSEASTEDDIQVQTVVGLDILSKAAPAGSSITAGGKTFTTTTSGDSLQVYVTGSSGKTYRLTGSADMKTVLLQMALSLEE